MRRSAVIDIHAHYYPASFLKLMADEGRRFGATCEATERGPLLQVGELKAGPLEERFTDLELRIASMDDSAVAIQALSLTQPMVYWPDEALSERLAAVFNDALAAAHEAYPTRLIGLATLPMQKPELALKELDRVAGLSGIRGVYMATRILERELSAQELFPVYERLEDLRLPVFLHPLNVIGRERLDPFFLHNLLGNPFDTAVAAAHLIFGGVLDRFPGLQVVLPHAGGALPFLIGRLHHGWRVRPECRHLERGPLSYLRRFHYDTVSHSLEALSYLVGLVGPDRIMLGSDFCFDMGVERPVESVAALASLSKDERQLILGLNACRLLGLEPEAA